jgi:hypothetical protein
MLSAMLDDAMEARQTVAIISFDFIFILFSLFVVH